MALSYLFGLVAVVLVPTIILWALYFETLKRYARIYVVAVVCTLAISVPWDLISVRERIWYFTEPQIVGVWLFGLPIEEWSFYILVTLLFATMTVLLWERFGDKNYVR